MSNKITKLLLFVGVVILFSCANPKKRPVDKSSVPAIERYQKKLKSFYDNDKTTPLNKEEKRAFEGIHFFPIDTTYIVKAHFERLKNQEKFKMPTTGEKEPWDIKYAKVTFDLHEKTHELIVYQNLDLLNEDGYEDYLFLPFLDETNGEETYGGGRYLDVENPHSDTLVLNFNLAYHPYCAYAAGYSCPIVPLENFVETRIESGVKF